MNYDLRRTLVRALVEGAVIFVGILGALFANSWWDTRQARDRERSYVVSLSEDFDENQIGLQRAIESAELIKVAALELLAIETPAQGWELGTDSLTALLQGLQGLPTTTFWAPETFSRFGAETFVRV